MGRRRGEGGDKDSVHCMHEEEEAVQVKWCAISPLLGLAKVKSLSLDEKPVAVT